MLALGFFCVAALLQFPGAMGNDARNQYAEAVSGHYTDWHPAVMAWLWSQLRHIADGPAPLWLLHLAAYWGGLALLGDGIRRGGHPRIALLAVLAGAFPPFFIMNGMVTKDVGMVAAWIAAVGLIFWFRAQQRRIPWLCGVLIAACTLYGTLVRANALFGLGPLLFYALASPRWLRNGRLIVGALVIAVLAIPVTQQVNTLLFHPVSRDPVHSLFLFDLAGIAAQEQDPGLLEPRATLTESELRNCYTPYWWDSFSPWGPCGSLVHRPDADHATIGKGLLSQWARTIAQHPIAYAEHRLKHFNSSLWFIVPLAHQRFAPDYRGTPTFKPVQVFTPNSIRFDLVKRNPLVWPVTWLVWGAALLILLARETATPSVLLARALIVSALGYSGAYLVISVATDIRYHYWSMLAVMLATLLVLQLLASHWRNRSRGLLVSLAAVGVVVAIGLAARLADFQAWVV